MVALAQDMATSPDGILQKLAETTLELCHAQKAWISLLESDGKHFYWPTITGQWACHVGGGTPREFGPCGTVLDRNSAQLMSHVERHFTYFAPVTPWIEEVLLIPFYVEGKAVGTIWVIVHDTSRRFDAEDLRVMTNLGTFAAAAYQTLQSLNATTKAHQELQQTAAALRRGEQKLRDFVENASIGMHWVGADGIVLWANRTELEMLGYSREEYIGHHITEFHADRPVIDDILQRLTNRETLHEYEVRLRCKDGSIRHVLVSSNVLWEDDKFVHTRCFTRDITERKQFEEALSESAERYRALHDALPVASFVCDRNAVIQNYNRRAVELWGREPKIGIEQHCGSMKLWLPDGTLLPHAQSPMMEVLRSGTACRNVEVFIERPDGSRLPVIVNFVALRNAQGEIVGVVTSFDDITERRQVQEVLRESEARLQLVNEQLESLVQRRTAALRHLSAHLMRVQDEEHRRVARELHDSLGQYLASVKMNLDSLGSSDTSNKAEALSAALESVEQSIVETRTLSCLLHPPMLDEVGFASAARWYADEFAKRSGMEVPSSPNRLPDLIEMTLFRILQESLTNVHRHSGSSSVEIQLKASKNQAVLTVRDFGRGMPAEFLQGLQERGAHFGVGLSGMRERVSDLDGQLEIQSGKHGTAIVATIPLMERAAEDSTRSHRDVAKTSAA